MSQGWWSVKVRHSSTTIGARPPVAITLHGLGRYAELLDHPARRCRRPGWRSRRPCPDWSASTVFFAITVRGPEQLDLAQLGAAAAERLERDVDARGDGAADVLARAG